MKKSTVCFTALGILLGSIHSGAAIVGTYLIPDMMEVRGTNIVVLDAASHGEEGWAAIDNTFDKKVVVEFTYTPLLADPTEDHPNPNFGQYWGYFGLHTGGGLSFRAGSDHGTHAAAFNYVAPVAGAQLLNNGDPTPLEHEVPAIFRLEIQYNPGALDNAVLYMNDVKYDMPDANYGFSNVRLYATQDTTDAASAHFTNMSVTVIPEPGTVALFMGVISLGLVLLVRRFRKAG